MVHFDFFRSMHCTIPAWSLAGMAAGQIRVARRIATISGFCDIYMALDSYFMTTSRHLLFNPFHAPNERYILGLPAGQNLRGMATKQSPTSLVNMDHTMIGTRIAAGFRTRMITSFQHSRTRLRAMDRVVENSGMALFLASMAAFQSVHAALITSSLGGILQEMVQFRHGDKMIWMAWALQLQTCAEVSILLQDVNDPRPHWNMD